MQKKRLRIVGLVLVLALSLLAVTLVLADTGGPDAFGYVYIDSQEPNGPVYDWVDISATGTPYLLGDDESTPAITLGFPFDFYGNTFTDAYADSNGYISFNSSQGGDFSNSCPIGADLFDGLAVYWDDLDPGDDGAALYFESFAAGSCPYDSYSGACAVFQYEEFDFFPGDGTPGGTFGTVEALLFDDHTAIYQYENISETGDSASIGIVNGDGTIELLYGNCNTAGTTANSRSVMFALLQPDIAVAPASVVSVQDPDTMNTEVLSITNNGDYALDWEIQEQVPFNPPPGVPSTVVERQAGTPGAPNPNYPSAPEAEQVQDGSFEAGSPNPFWTEASTNFGTPLCTTAGCGTGGGTGPNSGSWWAWFGGIAAYEEGSVSQDVVIPTSANDLTFYLEVPACSGAAADYMEVTMDGTQLFYVDAASPTCGVIGYALQTVDISAYADGATHTLAFHSEIFGTATTNFFVDDVSIFTEDPGDCSAADQIPWLSAAPLNGTTAVSATSTVDLTFDSTGLPRGTYTGTLCVVSNDPDTPELLVPVTMNVQTTVPTGVSLSGFGGETPAALSPLWLSVLLVLLAGLGLALRRKMA